MMLVLIAGGFFFAVDFHGDMRAGDPAFYGSGFLVNHAGNIQSVQFLKERVRIGHQFKKRCGQHIARGAHTAFDVECFHSR